MLCFCHAFQVNLVSIENNINQQHQLIIQFVAKVNISCIFYGVYGQQLLKRNYSWRKI